MNAIFNEIRKLCLKYKLEYIDWNDNTAKIRATDEYPNTGYWILISPKFHTIRLVPTDQRKVSERCLAQVASETMLLANPDLFAQIEARLASIAQNFVDFKDCSDRGTK